MHPQLPHGILLLFSPDQDCCDRYFPSTCGFLQQRTPEELFILKCTLHAQKSKRNMARKTLLSQSKSPRWEGCRIFGHLPQTKEPKITVPSLCSMNLITWPEGNTRKPKKTQVQSLLQMLLLGWQREAELRSPTTAL